MIDARTSAPDFELLDHDGRPQRLSDLKGKRIVLYFYPKADTPGCTAQACGVRDFMAEFEAAGAVVLGVSHDPPAALARFREKYGLGFTLLSDPGRQVAERYGVRVKASRLKLPISLTERTTFVIGPDGVVEHVFRRVDPRQHGQLILEALAPASGTAEEVVG